MASQRVFEAFLSNIEPSKSTIQKISSAQKHLRRHLAEHHSGYVDSYLTGSYARNTSIRPKKGDGKRDVDIVVVTNHDLSSTPEDVHSGVLEALSKCSTYKKLQRHSHSIGVEMSGLDIDVVPVIVYMGTTYIGDVRSGEWQITDPKGHIEWCSHINGMNNKKFIPCVKLLKWWRRNNFGANHGFPKGIALEKIAADNLPSCCLGTEEYFTQTLESMATKYLPVLSSNNKPIIHDPCVPSNNLFSQYDVKSLEEFFSKMLEHVAMVRENSTSGAWRSILGEDFPIEEDNQLSLRGEEEEFIDEIMPVDIQHSLTIDCLISQDGFRPFTLRAHKLPLKHKLNLKFYIVHTTVPKPYEVYWKVRNVGAEAEKRGEVRGQIIGSNTERHYESSLFQGPHYVECYLVKDGQCVASDRINVPIGEL